MYMAHLWDWQLAPKQVKREYGLIYIKLVH